MSESKERETVQRSGRLSFRSSMALGVFIAANVVAMLLAYEWAATHAPSWITEMNGCAGAYDFDVEKSCTVAPSLLFSGLIMWAVGVALIGWYWTGYRGVPHE